MEQIAECGALHLLVLIQDLCLCPMGNSVPAPEVLLLCLVQVLRRCPMGNSALRREVLLCLLQVHRTAASVLECETLLCLLQVCLALLVSKVPYQSPCGCQMEMASRLRSCYAVSQQEFQGQQSKQQRHHQEVFPC